MPKKKNEDKARKKNDAELKKIEKTLHKEYEKSFLSMKRQADKYFSKFSAQQERMLMKLDAGEITQKQFIDWYNKEVVQNKKYDNLVHTLAREMVQTDKMAQDIVAGHMADIYAEAYNYSAYEICKEAGYNFQFDLVDRRSVEKLVKEEGSLLPQKRGLNEKKDQTWNERKIRSAITQGIIRGDSVDNIAKRLRQVTDMDEKASVRNARTMTTSAECAGRQDRYEEAKEKYGIQMQKTWIATLDDRTRDEHAVLDGVTIDVDEKFKNEIGELMYPCDPDGDPENVYNCRCTMISSIKGYSHDMSRRQMDESLGGISYEEWKAQAEERIKEKEDRSENKETIERKEALDPESTTDIYEGRSIEGLTFPERPKRDDFYDENGDFDYDGYDSARDEYKREREEVQASLDSAIEASLSRTAFENYDEVYAWGEKMGMEIDPSVSEQIDIRIFNEIKPTLEEMFDKFPEVKDYKMEMQDGNLLETPFSIRTENIGIMSAGANSLKLNPDFMSPESYASTLGNQLRNMMDGEMVMGDGTFATAVRHEYGHNVQEYIQGTIRDKYHMTVDDWRLYYSSHDEYKKAQDAYHKEMDQFREELMALAGKRGSSNYSNTNDCELFAEAFAEWSSGGTSDFAKGFGELMERWY